jgi:NAD(P)-dependent dehydrogenase (short-subunit alcohol dehydrogenase family)
VNDQPVALVTGASSGIGLATAKLLSEQGYHVVLAARTPESLKTAADQLPGTSTIAPLDVAGQTQCRALIDRISDELGRLDVLINNAGYAPLLPIDQTDDATIEQAYRVNAIGPASLIAHAWPIFRSQRTGCIVNISTMGTDNPFPGFFAYASSKASVNLLARSCAKEGAEHNIRAFAVAPGAVETPMLRGLFSEEQLPGDECLSAEDVAEVIVACVAGEMDEKNGEVIWVSSAE